MTILTSIFEVGFYILNEAYKLHIIILFDITYFYSLT